MMSASEVDQIDENCGNKHTEKQVAILTPNGR
jgi:hypothetical protein